MLAFFGNSLDRVPPLPEQERSTLDTLLLTTTLGWLGAHHFYLRRPEWGCLYLFTLGLFGMGWMLDILRVCSLTRAANRRQAWLVREQAAGRLETVADLRARMWESERDSLDVLVLWAGGGFLGLHQFYLRKTGMGLLYFFSFGATGFYLFDVFRVCAMTKAANDYQAAGAAAPRPNGLLQEITATSPRGLGDALVIHCSLPGMFGASSWYLHKPQMAMWGLFPMLGGGWLVQLFTMPIAVRHCNARLAYQLKAEQAAAAAASAEEDPQPLPDKPPALTRHDAWALQIMLGIFGATRLYVQQTGWAVLYACTFGLFGIGWFVDFFRLGSLVADGNSRVVDTMCEPLVTAAPGLVAASAVTHPTGGFAEPDPSNYPEATLIVADSETPGGTPGKVL